MANIRNYVETVYNFREGTGAFGLANVQGKVGHLSGLLERTKMAAMGMGGGLSNLPGLFTTLTSGAAGAGGAVAAAGAALIGYGGIVLKVAGEHMKLRREIAGSMMGAYQFEGAKTPIESYHKALEASTQQLERFQSMQRETGATEEEMGRGFSMLTAAAERAGRGPGEVEKAVRAATLATKALGLSTEDAYFQLLTIMETGVARGEFAKRLGITAKDMSKMTDRERWDFMLQGMKKFETAGLEAAKTTGSQFRIMASELEDMFRETSGPSLKVVKEGMQEFIDLVRRNEPSIRNFFTGLSMEFTAIARVLREVLGVLGLVGDAFSKIAGVVGGGPSAAKISAAQMRMQATLAQTHATEAQILAAAAGAAGVSSVQRTFLGATGKMLPDYSVKELAKIYAADYELLARAKGDEAAKRAVMPGALKGVSVNVNNRFGDIHMNMEFRDVEPDRIAVVLKEKLERLGENRSMARTVSDFGS